MRIGGFQKTSLIEHPGKVSSVVFTIGCNLRCPFCYVPQLVLPEKIKAVKEISEDYIFSYLERNKGLVDAVVLTGGEPTLQTDLVDFVRKLKSNGLLVGIETNGTNPSLLSDLIRDKLVDYVAMDVKTVLNFEKYNIVVGGVLTVDLFEKIERSIDLLLSSDIPYEFRTTLVKELHERDDVLEICKRLKGARAYYLRNFKKVGDILGGRELAPFEEREIEEIVSEGRNFLSVRYRR